MPSLMLAPTMAMRELTLSTPGSGTSFQSQFCNGKDQFSVSPGGRLGLASGGCNWALAAWRQSVAGRLREPSLRPSRLVEKLWLDFFQDPSEWWDKRQGKLNDNYPDFQHKKTKHFLWLNGKYKPHWVDEDLAALPPGTLQPDIFTWNKILSRYQRAGEYEKTMLVYQQMQQEGINLSGHTFVPVLKACTSLRALEVGRQVHYEIEKTGLDADVHVGSCLLDMYIKCGSLEDAWKAFNKLSTRDVVVWSCMIWGFAIYGQGQRALTLYQVMRKQGVEPNQGTFVAILRACTSEAALEAGKGIHAEIIQRGAESDVVLGTSLVDMYTKCGSIDDALTVFQRMQTRNVVAWTAIIAGCAKCGYGQKALELFWQMEWEGVEPNAVTFVGVLNACSRVGALEEGRRIHDQVMQTGCKSNMSVLNSLINMYAKCGNLEDAIGIFKKMDRRNVVSWTTMIGGYAMHGQASRALELFERMYRERVEMNEVTFVALLLACSHSGLLDEGLHYFGSMSDLYQISPNIHHYAFIIDLLGRAGRVDEAKDLIKQIPVKQNEWMALVTACSGNGSDDKGERIAELLLELELKSSEDSEIPSNISVRGQQSDKTAHIQRRRLERAIKNHTGCSWIEVNDAVHSFTADDQNHPQLPEIHSELSRLSKKMGDAGLSLGTKLEGLDVSKGRKEMNHCDHTLKLAIGFGLISTLPGTQLRIFKNQRMCNNCHTASKLIARIAGRLITVRDGNRFHFFQDGLCSCKDYW